jgi:hypothetical protein
VLVLAALAAWGFAQRDFRGRETLLAALVSLMVVPPVVLLLPLFGMGSDLDLVGTYEYVILIYVGFMLPFSIYMLTNFFRTIPRSLIEAAVVDGASSWDVFRRIVLPLSRAPLATLAVVNLLSMFGLHRRLRGECAGALAVFEMTSCIPNRRYGDGMRRLGFDERATRFFDEHVEADAVHEAVAAHDLAAGLALQQPGLAGDILFGAEALLFLDGRFAGHLIAAWSRGKCSLRRPLRETVAAA